MQAMVAGGSGEYCSSATTPAGNKSWIFDVSPGADHSLIEEELNFPRVVRRKEPKFFEQSSLLCLLCPKCSMCELTLLS